MNPNMNMHAMPQQQQQMGGVGVGPNTMGVSPLMQSSPQQPQPQQQQQMAPNPQQQQQQQQQQADKLDNVSKVKILYAPMRESLLTTFRAAAFTLQQNNLTDNLKREIINSSKFDKHLEEFYAYCDQIELQLKTVMQCMQQLSSSQHYMPGAVAPSRTEPYLQDNPGPMPYPTFLNTVRVHIQSTKDLRDTLISASQNISQAD